MAWDAGTDQTVWRKRHGLHLSVGTHVKGVGPDRRNRKRGRNKEEELQHRPKKQEEETYGFPADIPGRFTGWPGTRMWG